MVVAGVQLILDVILYISDSAYRRTILNSIDARVRVHERAGMAVELVIAGHSLGSLIAVDYLRNFAKPARFRSVTLITAGSPIRRFIQRFFPGHILPSDIAQLARDLQKHPSFSWHNYYRVLDIVGGRLNLPEDQIFRESSHLAMRGPVYSHLNYWNDRRFHSFIVESSGTPLDE